MTIFRDYLADAIREQEWPPIAGGEEPEESDAAIIALIRRAAENDGCLDEIAPADALRLCDLAEEVGRLRWVEQAARAISWLSVDNVQAVAPIERVRELNAALAAAQQAPADG